MPSAPAFYRTLSMGRRGPMTRQEFRQRIVRVLGVAPVVGFLPRLSDTTTTVCPWSGKVLTADGTMTLTALGRGATRTFNGTSNNLTTPDAADLSFGNGTTDSPMTVFALANVVDTAAGRVLIAKFDATNTIREWNFNVNLNDFLNFTIRDESAAVVSASTANAIVTHGTYALYAASYSGVGGANAGDGIGLFTNGAAIAATVGNNASYVAMENTNAGGSIGSQNATPSGWLNGASPFMLVAPVNASAAQHAAVAALCRQFFGVPL